MICAIAFHENKTTVKSEVYAANVESLIYIYIYIYIYI